MRRTLVTGVACCVVAAIVFVLGQMLGLPSQDVLVAAGGGAILAIVRDGSPLARYGSFLIGLIAGFAYFAAMAAFVPGNWVGVMVATIGGIILCTLISALTRGRLPLWAMFLGVVLFVSAYKPMFENELWLFESQSVMVLCWSLFAVTCGFLVVIVVELLEPRQRHGDDPIAAAMGESDGGGNAGIQIVSPEVAPS